MFFGMAPRKCIGMALALTEMKVLLAVLARDYRYSADWDTRWKYFPLLRPAAGLPVLATRLQPADEDADRIRS